MKDDEPLGTRETLLQQFGDWPAPIPELICKTESYLKNSLCDRRPTRGWSRDHAVLLGDAAHPTTPNLGQGACVAIEGAWLLAACIKEFGLNMSAFTHYEKLHFSRTATVVNTSLRMGKFGQWENGMAVAIRNAMFRRLPAKVAMKMIDQFFNYDATQVVVRT